MDHKEVSVNAYDQSAEEWAESARFSEPLRLGEVEQGILARRPVKATGAPWWASVLGVVGWAALALAFILGPGVSLLGAVFVWLGTQADPPAGADFWLGTARWVFLLGALAYVFYLVEVMRARRRRRLDQLFAGLTIVGCLATDLLLRRATSPELPWGLKTLVWALALVAVAVLVASIASKPLALESEGNSKRKPPNRGPEDEKEYERYVRTRELVLNIMVHRGLLNVDPIEEGRLNSMPLGYWEELDGVDERRWRHILEYATIGWREFTESDRRVWSPPEKQTKREV